MNGNITLTNDSAEEIIAGFGEPDGEFFKNGQPCTSQVILQPGERAVYTVPETARALHYMGQEIQLNFGLRLAVSGEALVPTAELVLG